jgi:purine catabolism regulator
VDASFVDTINGVLTRILNYQAELLIRSEEVHRRFTEVVLDGGGLYEIAGLLSTILGLPVTILGAGGSVLASAGMVPQVTLSSEEGENGEGERLLYALGSAAQVTSPGSGQHAILQRKVLAGRDGAARVLQRSIKTGRLHYGEIVVWETGEEVKESDLAAIEHAATVAALAILKARAVSEVELRFRNDFLNDLLSGNIRDRAALLARAELFGWRLSGPYAVITAELHGDEIPGRPGQSETHGSRNGAAERNLEPSTALETARRLGRLVYDTARRLDPGVITWSKTDSVVVLCSLPANAGAPEAKRRAAWLAEQLQKQVTLDDGLTWTWGVGGFYPDLLDLHKAYGEARLAASIGRLVGEPGKLNHYDEMGVYRLLHHFPEPQQLEEFARQALGPVLDYDAQRNGQLLLTVEKYLACDRNLALAARELCLHYNTVKYRVQKADTLLSGALHNPHRRLELELALKALKLRGD